MKPCDARTSDHFAGANLCFEVFLAVFGRVEPGRDGIRSDGKRQRSAGSSLLASVVVGCCFVVEVASIFNGDIIPLLRHVGAVAFLENGPCDAHCSC